MWIYQHKNWPNFTWDDQKLAPLLAATRHQRGRLLGKMESLGFDLGREALLQTLTNDAVKSSAIEGETLNPLEVRSSIARRLGININDAAPVSRSVDGIVQILCDATQNYGQPLTHARLFAWHAALFPTGRSGMHDIGVGQWRDDQHGPMQVVSGPIGHETLHFAAPHAKQLEAEMQVFLKWFAQADLDPVLKAGIAHLWFVTIHPFDDGNGRIGRAIADMALAQADNTSYRFYSLSAQFDLEREAYYQQLERQQRGTPDITGWLEWFLGCLQRAFVASEAKLSKILFKAQLWQKINHHSGPMNERQRLIINRMLEDTFEGYMNTAKYAKLAKCSPDTALRDIQELKNGAIFIQNAAGGRSTSYRLSDV